MSPDPKRSTLAKGRDTRPPDGDGAPDLEDDSARRRERDEKLLDYLVKKDLESILELAKR